MTKKAVKKAAMEKVELPEQTIFDLVKREQKMTIQESAKPPGKVFTKQLFKMWCVLPDIFKGAPERAIALLGYQDPVTIKLLQTPTMTAFCETYGVAMGSLTRWKNEVETSDEYMVEVRKAFKPLTKNVVAALYRKMLEEGDGPRFTAYMKVIEGWREQLGIEHSGNVETTLAPEEREALDRLLEKSTKP